MVENAIKPREHYLLGSGDVVQLTVILRSIFGHTQDAHLLLFRANPFIKVLYLANHYFAFVFSHQRKSRTVDAVQIIPNNTCIEGFRIELFAE